MLMGSDLLFFMDCLSFLPQTAFGQPFLIQNSTVRLLIVTTEIITED